MADTSPTAAAALSLLAAGDQQGSLEEVNYVPAFPVGTMGHKTQLL